MSTSITLANLPSVQPVEGKTAIILTDLTKAGLTPASADTFRFLLGQHVGAIVAVPARLNIDLSTNEAHHTYCNALVSCLEASTAEDLQKITVTSAASVGVSVLPGVFSNGHIGDNIIFINDTYDNHPTAVAFRNNWNNSVLEVQGSAFGGNHNSIWPLSGKTVLVVTDANTETECKIAIETVSDLLVRGAASIHVIVTSVSQQSPRTIASALKVTVESQPPVRADSALWKRKVSVSYLSSSQGAASVTAFSQSFVSAHALVNDTCSASTNDVIANIAFSNFRHQAVGLLRRSALAVGDLSGSSIQLHQGQEHLKNVWPVKTKRFVFLVDGSVIFENSSSSSSAATPVTFQGIAKILKSGGNVLLVPSDVSNIQQSELAREQQSEITDNIIGRLQEDYDITPSEVVVFNGEDFIPRHLGRTSSVFVAFSNAPVIHENIIKSCDVFVRDTTFFGKTDQNGEALLQKARSDLGHIAIGNAASVLNVDLAPSSPILFGASSNPVFRAIFGNIIGRHFTGANANNRTLEAQEMRKPVDGGEGSLMSNVVSSLATTVLLHPLQLFIYPVPNPQQLPAGMSFLSLRCLHAIARDLLFYGLTKKNNANSNGSKCPCPCPKLPGWLAGVSAGVLSDPLRSVAYGGVGNSLFTAPATSVITSIGDPVTAFSTALMNFAPQASFQLSVLLNKNLRRFVPPNVKIQIGLILNALARMIVCVLLHKLIVMRRRYPSTAGIVAKTDGKNVLAIYMIKEVLSLFIETFVQRYFR